MRGTLAALDLFYNTAKVRNCVISDVVSLPRLEIARILPMSQFGLAYVEIEH